MSKFELLQSAMMRFNWANLYPKKSPYYRHFHRMAWERLFLWAEAKS